jgi:hypothetical protein
MRTTPSFGTSGEVQFGVALFPGSYAVALGYWDQPELPPYGATYYDETLPQIVAELDGRTPYWPGSPYGGDDHNPQFVAEPVPVWDKPALHRNRDC